MNIPIIDSHCHIYPYKIAEKAVEAIGDFYKLPMAYDGKDVTMLSESEKQGICHNVVFSVATTPHQVSSINRFIADSVKQSGGKMTGLGSLHPDCENLSEEIEHIKQLGLKGVKLHPDFQRFRLDGERGRKIFSAVGKDLPVLLHTGDSRYDFSNPQRMKKVLEAFPEVTFIGAHLGGWSVWDEAYRTLANYSNFYVDTSSSFHWLTKEKAEEYIRGFGADKVLFATDFPMWSYKEEKDFFFSLDLTEKQQEAILYKNACRLFGITL